MLKSTLATYPHGAIETGYAENLVQAARGFVAALFAVRPVPTVSRQSEVTPRRKAATVRELYRMAANYDSISPSLAAELRHLAGRD
jgi:hypothetical protein